MTVARNKLLDLEHNLEWMHQDRSGAFLSIYRTPPLLRPEWRHLEGEVAMVEARALGGCDYSADWLLNTAELRGRVEYLNNKPLLPRDPDYAGPPVWPFKFPRRNPRNRRPRLTADGAAVAPATAEAQRAVAGWQFDHGTDWTEGRPRR
jgi:hypothetical protein